MSRPLKRSTYGHYFKDPENNLCWKLLKLTLKISVIFNTKVNIKTVKVILCLINKFIKFIHCKYDKIKN